MVNAGKRSRGCDSCKNQHKKCDETFPSCRRCTVAGHRCPGVTKKDEMFFRNQTQSVTRKVTVTTSSRKVCRTKRHVSNISNSSQSPDEIFEVISATSSNGSTHSEPDTPVSQALSPNREDVALNYYLGKLEGFACAKVYNAKLLTKLAQTLRCAPVSSPLYRIITAIGLSWLSDFPEFTHLKKTALAEYITALRLVKDDVLDPATAKCDETVVTVLLFTMFETSAKATTSTKWSANVLKSFHNHEKGCLAVIRNRGYAQFQNPTDLSMFRGTRNYMAINSVYTSTVIDTLENDVFWTSDDALPSDPLNPFDKLCILILRLPALRVQASRLSLEAKTNATEIQASRIVADALELDENLQQWYLDLPMDHHYSIACLGNESIDVAASPQDIIDNISENIWPGQIHRYTETSIALLVTRYRVMSLFVQDIVLSCADHLPTTFFPNLLIHKAHTNTQQLVEGICASVPYQLNMDLEASSTNIKICRRRPVNPEATDIRCLLFPLDAAENAQGTTPLQKHWLKKQRQFISEKYDL